MLHSREGSMMTRFLVVCAVVVTTMLVGGTARVEATHGNSNGYDWAEVSDLWEAPPTSATNLNLGFRDFTEVSLPFAFPYWGGTYDSMFVTSLGYVLFAPDIGTPAQAYAITGRFPPAYYTESVVARSTDGMLAAYSTNLDVGAQGDVFVHVEGTPPRRTVVVSWVNCTLRSGNAGLSFQARMQEGTGLVTLAYEDDDGSGNWPTAGSDHSFGVEAPRIDDDRFVVPGPGELREGQLNLGHPGTDYQFTPVQVTISGRLLMDELVSDATGIGNTVTEDVAVAGLPIEFRWGATFRRIAGRTITDANGDFSIDCFAMPDDDVLKGTLYVQAQTVAATVRATAGGAVLEGAFKTNVDLYQDVDVGTVVLDATNDVGAAIREPLHIAMTVAKLHATASPHVTETVLPLDVLFDSNSSTPSSYTAATMTASASLRIASGTATNPDGWDDAMIARVFGRHVLTSAAGAPATAADATFDGKTDGPNAFAEGFGYYLHALATGSSDAVDGLGPSSATVFDLEDPGAATPGGPDVAAWVAANLYDLADGTDESEPHDRASGGVPERVLTIVDGMSGSIDAEAFYVGWGAATPEAGALARLTIHHGIVADDASEPNNDVGEPAVIGAVPQLSQDRVLNLYDEDWFEVTLPGPVTGLVVEMERTDNLEPFGRPEAELQLRSGSDALLATGVVGESDAVLVATTGALGAGIVRIRVRHTSGAAAIPYRVQISEPLAITSVPLPDWTEGVDYDASLGVVGGVAPLQFDLLSGELPAGMGIGAPGDDDRVTGRPLAAGEYNVRFRVRDTGMPQHSALASQALTINPPMMLEFGEFIGFPRGRLFTVERPNPGGTAPRRFDVPDASLPDGLAHSVADLRISGTATTAGATEITITGADATTPAAETVVAVTTTLVVCENASPVAKPAKAALAKKVPADLDRDAAAAGFWFDAVAGSTLNLSAATDKKQPKRRLQPVLVGPDGRTIEAEKEKQRKGGKGRASVKDVCPVSGRYFFVLVAEPGEATRLLGTVKVTPPSKGKLKDDSFGQDDEVSVTFGALTGAELTFTLKGDRRSDMTVRVLRMVSPSGQIRPGALLSASEKRGKISFGATLDESGTWTVVLRGAGGTGKLRVKYRLKQPKGAVAVFLAE